MILGLAVLALTAAFPAQPSSALRSDLYDVWVREGLKRQQARRWDAARICFERALEYRPGGEEATFGLALALSHLGKPSAAEAYLWPLLNKHPGHKDAAVLLARLLRARGAPDEAAKVLAAALEAAGDEADLHEELGAALLQAGKASAALSHLEKAFRLGRKDYRMRMLLGRAYEALKDTVRAETQFREALRLKPHDPVAASCLLDVYLQGGRWLDALALAQAETAAHPDNWRLWWGLAQAGLMLAEADRAVEGLSHALALAPAQDRRALALKAAKMGLAAQVPEATVAAVKATGKPDAELLGYLARAYEALGKTQQAAETWQVAARSKPSLLAEAARCWLSLGEKSRALSCLDRLGERDPRALAEAARLEMSLGHTDAAEQYLRRLLARSPHDAELHLDLASLLAKRGELGLAAAQAAEAARAAPDRAADSWRLRGAIYLRSSCLTAALAAYLSAWQADHQSRDAEAAARLMRLLGQEGSLASLLAQAGTKTEGLRVEAAWLALHYHSPDEALRLVAKLNSPAALEVRALAEAQLGKPEAVAHAAAAIKAADGDSGRLMEVFRRAATQPSGIRRQAINTLVGLIGQGLDGEEALDALDMLLEAEYGNRGKGERWVVLASAPEAPFALTRRAAEKLAADSHLPAALALIEAHLKQAQGAPKEELPLLGLAARLALEADKISAATDYLSRAAALAGEPLVISRLAALSPLRRLRPETSVALEELARAWEEAAPVEEAMLDFLLVASDEADVQAWIRGRDRPASQRALLAGKLALALGQPAVALARLRDAPPGPSTWQAEVEALLRQGKPAEAEPFVAALLRSSPGPEAYALAAALASQEQEWCAAAWWYACAIAAGEKSTVNVAALSRAAQRAHLSDVQRRHLAEQAAAVVVADSAERSRARRTLKLALGLTQAAEKD